MDDYFISLAKDSNVEDDDDYENLVMKEIITKEFDLALRKFITEVDGKAIDTRYPVPVVDEKNRNNKI